ncbi:hypothetical protein FRZ67_10765 [Panacibacter ginsenosidivorans]|uniref:Uncharacterized protein n=1 Tax=Panacibacter ginsenosidivorans TaxID=1813871 RepID=A0A5B8V9Z8_9BACT|nr:hypothetical protein [Panacibacter ginsenosidivorans]QEC67753.1 hypothetical protein FRZ67_10765 [Panacibacter ginsenosidivorans]
MKTILILFITAFLGINASAQQDGYCGLERLFALNKNLSKEAIADSVKNIYGAEALNINTAGNSAPKELLIYHIRNSECFNGNNIRLRFEFLNNKLVKAYMQTEFARTDYYQMLDNFNALRNFLRLHWEKEKEIKFSSTDLISTGFDFTKPKQSITISDKIALQYINTRPDKGYGIYLLRLSWVNSNNADIENIVY